MRIGLPQVNAHTRSAECPASERILPTRDRLTQGDISQMLSVSVRFAIQKLRRSSSATASGPKHRQTWPVASRNGRRRCCSRVSQCCDSATSHITHARGQSVGARQPCRTSTGYLRPIAGDEHTGLRAVQQFIPGNRSTHQ